MAGHPRWPQIVLACPDGVNPAARPIPPGGDVDERSRPVTSWSGSGIGGSGLTPPGLAKSWPGRGNGSMWLPRSERAGETRHTWLRSWRPEGVLVVSRIHFPEAVKRTVRRQCKFGCVLCGCPLYHYDHIVEYSEVEAHEASNIALLCGTHHDQKTRNQIPASAVRRAKNRVVAAGRRLRDGSIGLYFENNIRIILGSNTIVAHLSSERPFLPVVYVDDTIVLGLRFEDDMPLIYAKIYDRNNLLVLDIEDSEMRVGEHLWDVTYVGTLLTLKSAEGQVLLQIRFNPASGEIDVRRGEIYANGVGIGIANGNVTVLNDGSEFSHNFSHALGFAFGEQQDPELRRASYFMGARNVPRFTYEREPREENILQPDSVEGAEKVLHQDVK